MKKIFIFLFAAIGFYAAFSQDIITKKNGNEIKAKVMEVTSTEVKYKKVENLNGPLYTLAIAEIFMVKYENGEKDIFNSKTVTQKPDGGNKISVSDNATALSANSINNAKPKFNIGTNSGVLFPVSGFSSLAKAGCAFSVKGEYALNKKMAMGLSLGYYAIAGKAVSTVPAINIPFITQYTTTTNSFAIIPIILDYKFYFNTGNFMPYAGIGLGFYYIDVSGSKKNDYGLVPKIGFLKGERFKWGVSLDFNIVSGDYSSVNFIGINTGFLLPIGK